MFSFFYCLTDLKTENNSKWLQYLLKKKKSDDNEDQSFKYTNEWLFSLAYQSFMKK